MNVALLPLLPRGIQFRRRPFRVLKDRHLYDSVDVLTTDISADYFKTAAAKRKSQAIFTGDLSLVKEANIFLVMQIQALIRDRVLTSAEWKAFYNKGWFKFDVIVPETVTVDEDRLSAIAPGPDLERFTTSTDVNEAVDYGRHYVDRRTYMVGENKIVPGGRAIEFTLNWQEAGGNGLTTTTGVSIVFAGGEYEPGSAKE